MWRKFRVVILLLILATVLQELWLDKADLAWEHNLYVAVYPINADDSEEVGAYLRTLSRDDFEPMVEYFAEEAQSYQLGLRHPIEVQLGALVKDMPPEPPHDGSVLSTMLWSLKFRFFAWQNSPKVNIKPDIRLYLLYHSPRTNAVLGHSTALNKGRIGRVNLFAGSEYAKKNLVVTAHELLHTLNATDKYDLQSTMPIYPDGYAEPDKMPLLPQNFAELMGGRIPKSDSEAVIPKSLKHTMIGDRTAREIGWLR